MIGCVINSLIDCDDFLLIFVALENAEDVDPHEGGCGDVEHPHGRRHEEEVDVLHRHPKSAACL